MREKDPYTPGTEFRQSGEWQVPSMGLRTANKSHQTTMMGPSTYLVQSGADARSGTADGLRLQGPRWFLVSKSLSRLTQGGRSH